MPKTPEVVFKIYSDEEIKRLNYYIVNMEEQMARALSLHQMLGEGFWIPLLCVQTAYMKKTATISFGCIR